MILALFTKNPAWNVILGGLSTCVILLLVLGAALYFRYRRLPRALTPGRLYDVALWISSAAILAVGVYAAVTAVLDYQKTRGPQSNITLPASEGVSAPPQTTAVD
jgi:hypothetical protein